MWDKTRIAAANAILPAPFAWVEIPAGEVTLDRLGGYLTRPVTVGVPAFAVSKYPLTRAQYQAFVDAPDGFRDPAWWNYSATAREWRGENPQPRHVNYGEADHPRTHVTWYEAVAFCGWLSARTGQIIRLPSEAEWQRAAQGDDGRLYPWGNEWDADRCHNNTHHTNIGATSVLTYAGKGDSPFGVVDMSGNVWEWCSTSWDSGADDLDKDDVRVLRGGSWFDDVIRFFRVTERSSWQPDDPSDLRGFRIARAI